MFNKSVAIAVNNNQKDKRNCVNVWMKYLMAPMTISGMLANSHCWAKTTSIVKMKALMFKVCLSSCWHFNSSRTVCDRTNTFKANKLLRFFWVSFLTQSWKSYQSSERNWQIDKRRIWNLKDGAGMWRSPPNSLHQWWIKELRCDFFLFLFFSQFWSNRWVC